MSSQDFSVASSIAGTELSNLYGVIDKDNTEPSLAEPSQRSRWTLHQRVYGLNLAVPEDARAVIKPWDEREDTTAFAESGVDDQVACYLSLPVAVNADRGLNKDSRGEIAPRHLRIYANHPTIVDFADAEAMKPHLNITLLEGEPGVIEYPLRVAAFTSITSLSLFFSESAGGDVSRIYYIGFKGDMRSPRRDANSKLEIPASNAADAPLVDKVAEKTAGQQTTAR
ncbi:hypothetical protein H0H92_002730 [Tricholoma furcatifolium]|nr:hypothetical protein H0H92_002730 [Tricholoma furcatifolium]